MHADGLVARTPLDGKPKFLVITASAIASSGAISGSVVPCEKAASTPACRSNSIPALSTGWMTTQRMGCGHLRNAMS